MTFKSNLPTRASASLLLILLMAGLSFQRFLEYQEPYEHYNSISVFDGGRQLQTSTTNITYKSDLQCADCLIGNYTYCVKGAEQYTGKTAIQGYCCQNTSSCPYVNNTQWNCSSKYTSAVDKFRVCPFNTTACGTSAVLNLTGVGDTSCLKINNLKAGNVCLYKVTSQCGTPNFQINDTQNVIIQTQLISTSALSFSIPCFSNQSQQCFCSYMRDSKTKLQYLQCDCEKYSNITLSTSDCSCKNLTDGNGNNITQCYCNAPNPLQAYQNQTCSCVRMTNSTNNSTYLSCNCSSQVGNNQTNASLSNSQCTCRNTSNSTNSTNNQTQQQCNCTNVPQCKNPLTYIKTSTPSCNDSFSCSCLNTTDKTKKTWWYSCNCTNKTNQATSYNQSIGSAQCSCQPQAIYPSMTSLAAQTLPWPQYGSSWFQNCSCCLNSTQKAQRFFAPLTCSTITQKQSCQCSNSTNSTNSNYTCNCSHPSTNVVVSNINQTAASCRCPFNNSKTCDCCVSQDIQLIQLQPQCQLNTASLRESCNCTNVTASNSSSPYNCSCKHPTTNISLSKLIVDRGNCYCSLTGTATSMKACNCCLSYDEYVTQLYPTCPALNLQQNCSCVNITNSTNLNCSCAHSVTMTRVGNINMTRNSCYCQNWRNNQSNQCLCCANQTVQGLQLQPKCLTRDAYQNCTCVNTTTNSGKNYSMNCTCSNKLTNVRAANVLTNSSCYCDNTKSGSKACNCCADASMILTQNQPQCVVGSVRQQCSCSNLTNSTSSCNCTNFNQITPVYRKMTLNNTACYCNMTNGNMKTCNCCVSSANMVEGSKLMCLADTSNTTCSCRNISLGSNRYQYSCNCTNSLFWNTTVANLNISNSTCDCVNKTTAGSNVSVGCFCCLPQYQLVNNPKCSVNASVSNCSCQNITDAKTKTTSLRCNCSGTYNNVSVLSSNLTQNQTNCGCYNVSVGNSSYLSCNCCVNTTQWMSARPVCNIANSAQQSCFCRNLTNATNNQSYYQCNCTNKQTPRLPLSNLTFPVTSCGCDVTNNTNKTCDCCVTTTQNDTAFLNNLTCRVNNTNSNCSCFQSSLSNSSLTCTCSAGPMTYSSISVNKTSCNCLQSNSDPLTCRCCINETRSSKFCPVTYQSQNCDCVYVYNSTTRQTTPLCNCTNSTSQNRSTNVVVNTTNCDCSPVKNGTFQYQQCACCMMTPLSCPTASNIIQNCSCKNITVGKTWQWSCSCMRSNDSATGDFNHTATNCRCNDDKCQCCLTTTQLATQTVKLTCLSNQTQGNCRCSNVTNNITNTSSFSCNCSNTINSQTFSYQQITGINATQSCQCFKNNLANCTCCLQNTQVKIVQPQCLGPANNLNCTQCVSSYSALTKKTSQICNCTERLPNNQTLTYTNLNVSNSTCNCISQGNTNNCTCCLVNSTQQCQDLSRQNFSNYNCNCSQNLNKDGSLANCSCNLKVNATKTVYIANTSFSSSSCCCVNITDAKTKQTYQSCNCSAPVTQRNQTCQCLQVTDSKTKISTWNCNCTDCNYNNQNSLSFNSSRCSCATSKTTTTPRNCSCLVDFQGTCAPQIDEDTCIAFNMWPKSLNSTANSANLCKSQYEYYVAVVAKTGKDSNVLLQLQSQSQMDYSSYLSISVIGMMIFAMTLFVY